MSTSKQHNRGSRAMSLDIDARFPKRDPILARLEGSRDIAIKERDAALVLVAELTKELANASRCLRSARLSHDLQKEQWQATEKDLRFRLNFAAEHMRRHRIAQEEAATLSTVG